MHLPRCQSLQFGLRMSGRLPFFFRWHILYFGQYQTRQHRTEQNKTQTGLIAGAGICITHAYPDYPYFVATSLAPQECPVGPMPPCTPDCYQCSGFCYSNICCCCSCPLPLLFLLLLKACGWKYWDFGICRGGIRKGRICLDFVFSCIIAHVAVFNTEIPDPPPLNFLGPHCHRRHELRRRPWLSCRPAHVGVAGWGWQQHTWVCKGMAGPNGAGRLGGSR